jgi:hypothetical protein
VKKRGRNTEIAKMLGVSRQTVSEMFAGRSVSDRPATAAQVTLFFFWRVSARGRHAPRSMAQVAAVNF